MKGDIVSSKNIAAYIDHTLLKPEATETQILKVIEEAKKFQFAGVCVNSGYLPLVADSLKNTSILPVAVIGFPLGAMNTESKVFEAAWIVQHGALEVDMVINVGALKDKKHSFCIQDISSVVHASAPAKVKVIIETSLLNEDEKRMACKIALDAGAHFVKTSTGFSGGGATVADITLMREVVGSHMQIKASGGIKNKEMALALIAAGADRLGTSSGVSLVEEGVSQGGY